MMDPAHHLCGLPIRSPTQSWPLQPYEEEINEWNQFPTCFLAHAFPSSFSHSFWVCAYACVCLLSASLPNKASIAPFHIATLEFTAALRPNKNRRLREILALDADDWLIEPLLRPKYFKSMFEWGLPFFSSTAYHCITHKSSHSFDPFKI